MISKFSLQYKMDEETTAYIVEDVDIDDNFYPGIMVKIFIPSMMINIKMGDPCISIASSNGLRVFKNSSECKPYIGNTILKQKNYMLASLLNNSSIDNICIVEYEDEEKTKIKRKYIPKGTRVRSVFLNGKLSKLGFNTDISTGPKTDMPDTTEAKPDQPIPPLENTGIWFETLW